LFPSHIQPGASIEGLSGKVHAAVTWAPPHADKRPDTKIAVTLLRSVLYSIFMLSLI